MAREKQERSAAQEYVALWGAHAAAARNFRVLCFVLAGILVLCVVGWMRTATYVPQPVFVRVDEVGRAEVVDPARLHWEGDPTDPVTRFFLTRFIRDHVTRLRTTARDSWTRSLFFLSQQETSRAIERDSDAIAAVLRGEEPEREVENIMLRIHPRPTPPHAAEATFDLLRPGAEGLRRSHWTATLEFDFVEVSNPEFALVNPTGLVISYLRLDEATSAR